MYLSTEVSTRHGLLPALLADWKTFTTANLISFRIHPSEIRPPARMRMTQTRIVQWRELRRRINDGWSENEGCVGSPTTSGREPGRYVRILAAFFCYNALYSPPVGFLPFHSLLWTSTAAQNHAHRIFRYVCWPTYPQRLKLTLFYSFDKAPDFLPRLGAWTPQPAMPSARFVVGWRVGLDDVTASTAAANHGKYLPHNL